MNQMSLSCHLLTALSWTQGWEEGNRGEGIWESESEVTRNKKGDGIPLGVAETLALLWKGCLRSVDCTPIPN